MRTTANGRSVKTLPVGSRPEATVQPQQPQGKMKKALPVAALLQSHKFKLNP